MKRFFLSGTGMVLLCLLSTTLYAQFSLTAEVRPRTEFSHGYKTLASPNDDLSTFTTQRTRLGLFYYDDDVMARIVMQDVRLWGSQPQLVANEDFGVSVHEAWAQAFISEDFSFRAGRQEVVYDDHRIFGNVGWAQQGRSHDMIRLIFERGIKIHTGFAYHENSIRSNNLYTGPDAYKTMQYLWMNKMFLGFNVSILGLNVGVPVSTKVDSLGNVLEQKNNYAQTLGLYAEYGKFRRLSFNGNVYYQMGKDVLNTDINAWEFALGASYNFRSPWKIKARYEMLSGNDQQKLNNENNAFTPYFGTNHKFNGHMDYFYVGNHLNNVGLSDVSLSVNFEKKKLKAAVTAHYFSAAANPGAGLDKYLGTELDFMLAYDLHKAVDLKFGYSRMLASETMEVLKNGDKDEPHYWAWIMASFDLKGFLVD